LNHDPTADLNELSTRRFLRSRSLFGQTGGHPADKTGWIGRKWPKADIFYLPRSWSQVQFSSSADPCIVGPNVPVCRDWRPTGDRRAGCRRW